MVFKSGDYIYIKNTIVSAGLFSQAPFPGVSTTKRGSASRSTFVGVATTGQIAKKGIFTTGYLEINALINNAVEKVWIDAGAVISGNKPANLDYRFDIVAPSTQTNIVVGETSGLPTSQPTTTNAPTQASNSKAKNTLNDISDFVKSISQSISPFFGNKTQPLEAPEGNNDTSIFDTNQNRDQIQTNSADSGPNLYLIGGILVFVIVVVIAIVTIKRR